MLIVSAAPAAGAAGKTTPDENGVAQYNSILALIHQRELWQEDGKTNTVVMATEYDDSGVLLGSE